MVDAMHEACLRPLKDRLPKELTNTTFVYRIFGGRLRSQVRGWGCIAAAAPHPDMQGDATTAPAMQAVRMRVDQLGSGRCQPAGMYACMKAHLQQGTTPAG